MKKNLKLFQLFVIFIISYSASAQVPTSGLIGYWPFNGNAYDMSGNNHNGTVLGATLTNDRFGNPNSAYSFNGTNNYILVPGLTSTSKSYTFSLWVKPSGESRQFEYLFDTQFGRLVIGWQTSVAGYIGFFDGGAAWQTFGNTPTGTNWRHVVITFDNSSATAKLYIDNVQSGTSRPYTSRDISGSIAIGSAYNYGGGFFKGTIDDYRIYNRALSASEIQSLFNENIVPEPTTGVWENNGNDIYYNTGKVGVGTSVPDEKLTVKGKIHSEEVIIDLNVPAPDYVFEKNYPLINIEQIESYINENKHLPEIPSAKEIEEKGLSVGEMNMKLLQKIEELTLYIIEQNKTLKVQQEEIKALKEAIGKLKK